ncbi:MAG: nickel pincer cofactor biosynthesis protein LarB [Pseudomonadota bacterium]
MDAATIRSLLQQVQTGALTVDAAFGQLQVLPFRQLGTTATVDHHRSLRLGIPEVVLGEGKSAEQIVEIMGELARGGVNVLATRVSHEKAELVLSRLPAARYESMAMALVIEQQPVCDRGRGFIAVVSAGTADMAVAEEAAVVAQLYGNRVERIYDVGIAGVHRVLARLEILRAAEVLVVVAGMEGALPSLVAGLVDRPVIAVPTSVGYGASFGGIAALLGMLTACAPGICVVNIDNGFGAAYAATLINRKRD